MKPTEEQIQSLKSQLRQMSAADLSMLMALPQSLREEESVSIATIAGSKNDLLWTQMAALNWMKLGEPLEEYPAAKVYVVSRDALEHIEALLEDLNRA